MKRKNICKFITSTDERDLRTAQFILENSPPYNGVETVSRTDCAMLILSGEGTYTSYGAEYRLEKGTLVFGFAATKYTISYENELSYIYIKYYGNRAGSLHERFRISPRRFIFPKMDSLIPMWMEGIVNSSDENADLLSESILLYTFSKLSTNYSNEDSLIIRLTEYLRDNFTDLSLSLQSVANEFGYSSKYLSRFIAKELNTNFSDYVKNLRMKRAMLLLEQGITSIKNLAILSGYSDPLYFSKVFKETFEASPKQYIKEKNTTCSDEEI
jgi:AraC-like DNA-binding protein